ncbi:unnamed protein product [Cylicocyclus nassatus]|uniref:Uncharacterized protein n=1 Tax=Cylicocyclus nassatus TaxID=53992 RepID=A0AA36GSJ0_CYLNA|nr:unnamed protein product [Cylicocyclus nassatus]
MSEYLGWTERRPPFGVQKPPRDDILPGGPVTQSYENYVKNVFHPMNRTKHDSAQMAADHGVSASNMLKMERTLGKHALDDTMDSYSFDDNGLFLKTPLEALYSELGLNKSEHALYRQFPVYTPKQSSEYFAISHGADRRHDRHPAPLYSSYREQDDDEYAKNNRKTLIDYKDFDREKSQRYAYDGYMYSPLSPYLYKEHPYIRDQDTRIVGSNFVQVTSRPKDRFLEKIDQTLAEVRAMPRYT